MKLTHEDLDIIQEALRQYTSDNGLREVQANRLASLWAEWTEGRQAEYIDHAPVSRMAAYALEDFCGKHPQLRDMQAIWERAKKGGCCIVFRRLT